MANRELTFDEAEAIGLDGTGRYGDPRFPYTGRTVELDWVDEDGSDTHGAETAARLHLDVEVVVEFGPGGGWPVLRFTGLRDDIDTLIREYSHDLDDVEGDINFYDVEV